MEILTGRRVPSIYELIFQKCSDSRNSRVKTRRSCEYGNLLQRKCVIFFCDRYNILLLAGTLKNASSFDILRDENDRTRLNSTFFLRRIL